jgi:capsule polysaccharide modification protein KpsS
MYRSNKHKFLEKIMLNLDKIFLSVLQVITRNLIRIAHNYTSLTEVIAPDSCL